jgi:hypothetical protein
MDPQYGTCCISHWWLLDFQKVCAFLVYRSDKNARLGRFVWVPITSLHYTVSSHLFPMPTSWYPAVKVLLIVAIFRDKATNLTLPGFYLLTPWRWVLLEKLTSKEGIGPSNTTDLCITLFIMLTTTCFGHCRPSSGHKIVSQRKAIQVTSLGCGINSQFVTRSHCF